MSCDACVEIKDRPNTYTKCKACNKWRLMSDAEKQLSAKPFRFGDSGQPTRNYK